MGKTPDTTRCYRDPAAYDSFKNAADYWRRNPGPEQPRSPSDTERWVGEKGDQESTEPTGYPSKDSD